MFFSCIIYTLFRSCHSSFGLAEMSCPDHVCMMKTIHVDKLPHGITLTYACPSCTTCTTCGANACANSYCAGLVVLLTKFHREGVDASQTMAPSAPARALAVPYWMQTINVPSHISEEMLDDMLHTCFPDFLIQKYGC